MKIHGTLENWHMCPEITNSGRLTGKSFLVGMIFGDTKNRFPDGKKVATSTVLFMPANEHFTEGDIAITRNSRYLLGAPAEEWGNPDEL